jgi:hypothetical protein
MTTTPAANPEGAMVRAKEIIVSSLLTRLAVGEEERRADLILTYFTHHGLSIVPTETITRSAADHPDARSSEIDADVDFKQWQDGILSADALRREAVRVIEKQLDWKDHATVDERSVATNRNMAVSIHNQLQKYGLLAPSRSVPAAPDAELEERDFGWLMAELTELGWEARSDVVDGIIWFYHYDPRFEAFRYSIAVPNDGRDVSIGSQVSSPEGGWMNSTVMVHMQDEVWRKALPVILTRSAANADQDDDYGVLVDKAWQSAAQVIASVCGNYGWNRSDESWREYESQGRMVVGIMLAAGVAFKPYQPAALEAESSGGSSDGGMIAERM